MEYSLSNEDIMDPIKITNHINKVTEQINSFSEIKTIDSRIENSISESKIFVPGVFESLDLEDYTSLYDVEFEKLILVKKLKFMKSNDFDLSKYNSKRKYHNHKDVYKFFAEDFTGKFKPTFEYGNEKAENPDEEFDELSEEDLEDDFFDGLKPPDKTDKLEENYSEKDENLPHFDPDRLDNIWLSEKNKKVAIEDSKYQHKLQEEKDKVEEVQNEEYIPNKEYAVSLEETIMAEFKFDTLAERIVLQEMRQSNDNVNLLEEAIGFARETGKLTVDNQNKFWNKYSDEDIKLDYDKEVEVFHDHDKNWLEKKEVYSERKNMSLEEIYSGMILRKKIQKFVLESLKKKQEGVTYLMNKDHAQLDLIKFVLDNFKGSGLQLFQIEEWLREMPSPLEMAKKLKKQKEEFSHMVEETGEEIPIFFEDEYEDLEPVLEDTHNGLNPEYVIDYIADKISDHKDKLQNIVIHDYGVKDFGGTQKRRFLDERQKLELYNRFYDDKASEEFIRLKELKKISIKANQFKYDDIHRSLDEKGRDLMLEQKRPDLIKDSSSRFSYRVEHPDDGKITYQKEKPFKPYSDDLVEMYDEDEGEEGEEDISDFNSPLDEPIFIDEQANMEEIDHLKKFNTNYDQEKLDQIRRKEDIDRARIWFVEQFLMVPEEDLSEIEIEELSIISYLFEMNRKKEIALGDVYMEISRRRLNLDPMKYKGVIPHQIQRHRMKLTRTESLKEFKRDAHNKTIEYVDFYPNDIITTANLIQDEDFVAMVTHLMKLKVKENIPTTDTFIEVFNLIEMYFQFYQDKGKLLEPEENLIQFREKLVNRDPLLAIPYEIDLETTSNGDEDKDEDEVDLESETELGIKKQNETNTSDDNKTDKTDTESDNVTDTDTDQSEDDLVQESSEESNSDEEEELDVVDISVNPGPLKNNPLSPIHKIEHLSMYL